MKNRHDKRVPRGIFPKPVASFGTISISTKRDRHDKRLPLRFFPGWSPVLARARSHQSVIAIVGESASTRPPRTRRPGPPGRMSSSGNPLSWQSRRKAALRAAVNMGFSDFEPFREDPTSKPSAQRSLYKDYAPKTHSHFLLFPESTRRHPRRRRRTVSRFSAF